MPYADLQKRKEYAKEYYKKYWPLHPEIRKKSEITYTANNKEKLLAKYRKYHANNKEKEQAYRKANPEKGRIRTALYKSRKLGALGYFTVTDWLNKLTYYGFKCVYCTKPLTTKTASMDHIIPLKRGGTNWPANIAPACGPCNSGKQAYRIYPLHLRKYIGGDGKMSTSG